MFFGNSMFLVNLLNIRKRIENFQSAEKTCERDSGKQLVVLHANTSNTQYVMINVPTSKIMKFAFMLRKHGMCWKNMCRINLATLLDATVMPPKNRIYEWTLYPCGPNNDMSLREETTGPCVGNTLQRRPFFFRRGEILRDGSAYRFILIAHRFIYRSLKFDIDTHGNPRTSSFGVSVSDHIFGFGGFASKVYEAYSCRLKRPKEGLRQGYFQDFSGRYFLEDWSTTTNIRKISN